jgi:hypothetical protein
MGSIFMSLKDFWRIWRRRLKAKLPYVRRREFRKLKQSYESRISGMQIGQLSTMSTMSWAPLASHAQLHAVKPLLEPIKGDICFFVTYAAQVQLKPHVVIHIEHLLRNGISVVLVINTSLAAHNFVLDAALSTRLSAIFVRENVGFDFAAWAHVHMLCQDRSQWERLFLINDSIVGPLTGSAFDVLIQRIRASSADVVGLTENTRPLPHLQSFFLVFNRTALNSAVLRRIFESTLSLSSKEEVIDLYEIQLTTLLKQRNLRCEALFPALTTGIFDTNDTYFRWEKLIDLGFPFIKASVLKEQEGHKKIHSLVPTEILYPQKSLAQPKAVSALMDSVGLDCFILEIGAGYNPKYLKSKYINTYHLDHLNTNGLREKYSLDPHVAHLIEHIQPIDFVSSGGLPHHSIPPGLRFDIVFGSHVLEHQVDFIGHLQSLEGLLHKGGKIIQIIPDLRTCFDVFRYPSVTSDALVVHMKQPAIQIHQGKQVFDSLSRAINLNPGQWISTKDLEGSDFSHTLAHAYSALQLAEKSGQTYIDAHAWTFTPESFRLLMIELRLLKLTHLVPTFISETYQNQFCVALEPAEDVLSDTSIKILEQERFDLCKKLRI